MIFDLPSVIKAYYSCRRGKRNCIYASEFEKSLESSLYILHQELVNRRYTIEKSQCFVITYPTTREIFAASFRDRVVHHLLINYIEKDIDKKFAYDSLACRKNKGALLGIRRLKSFLSKVTHNYTKQAYYLKLDIESFFYSIDKEILFKILREEIEMLNFSKKDKEDLIWISSEIIFHDPCSNYKKKGNLKILDSLPRNKSLFRVPKGKGLAIGNLTSQFFANLYLNEVDQYIKRELKVKYYLRYADDMLFLSDSIDTLEIIERKVAIFLHKRLKLKIKESKTKYGSVYQGIDFVGYIVKPTYTLCRNKVFANLKRKLYYFNEGYLINRKLCMEEKIPLGSNITEKDLKALCASINSTFGHLKWSNSYFLRNNIYNKHFGKLKEYIEPQDNLLSFRPSKPSI